MIKKIVLAILGLLIIAAVGIWYYAFIWSAGHHRNVEDEKAIHTTAASLVAAYEENEHAADSIFLDKAVQVTGEVVLVQYNQQGKQTVTLKSNDPMSNVFCTLKESNTSIKPGITVTIKGICTGYLSDAVVIGAVVTGTGNIQ